MSLVLIGFGPLGLRPGAESLGGDPRQPRPADLHVGRIGGGRNPPDQRARGQREHRQLVGRGLRDHQPPPVRA